MSNAAKTRQARQKAQALGSAKKRRDADNLRKNIIRLCYPCNEAAVGLLVLSCPVSTLKHVQRLLANNETVLGHDVWDSLRDLGIAVVLKDNIDSVDAPDPVPTPPPVDLPTLLAEIDAMED